MSNQRRLLIGCISITLVILACGSTKQQNRSPTSIHGRADTDIPISTVIPLPEPTIDNPTDTLEPTALLVEPTQIITSTFTPEPEQIIAPTATYEPTLSPESTATLAEPTQAMAPTLSPSICPQGCETLQPVCEIKGNISKDGEKIYHKPGWRDYGKTKINPENGERYFCTEQEAEANGWRAAQQ